MCGSPHTKKKWKRKKDHTTANVASDSLASFSPSNPHKMTLSGDSDDTQAQTMAPSCAIDKLRMHSWTKDIPIKPPFPIIINQNQQQPNSFNPARCNNDSNPPRGPTPQPGFGPAEPSAHPCSCPPNPTQASWACSTYPAARTAAGKRPC